jgi:uroporphyrinogen decarboxylase
VYEDGFMPLALRWTKNAEARLQAEGLGIKIVCARGPMVTAGWVMGVSDLMTGVVTHPKEIHKFLDTVTETIIRWLNAQLEQVKNPEGIFLLDDVAGMVSLEHYEEFVHPRLKRIFDSFDGLIKIYHNDMPCGHLFERFADVGFDVFNFTYDVDIAEAKAKMGHRVAMMGNVPPLAIAVRESPRVVAQWSKECLDKAGPGGGMILSVGGGVSPDMPAENIDAMLETARNWTPPTAQEHQAILERALANSGPKTRQRNRRRG